MKVLTILEVSQKQAYIFSSNKLRDNITNSAIIAWIMSPEYFEEVVGDYELFQKERNLVYSGGGHTVLEFDTRRKAEEFTKVITTTIHKEYQGIEVFAVSMECEDERLGENLVRLTEKLERKKSIRRSAFHQGSFGVEKINTNTLKPMVKGETIEGIHNQMPDAEEKIDKALCQDGYHRVWKFEELGGSKNKSNFIAVVHIDGNAMGKRVENLHRKFADYPWDEYKKELQKFSKSIDDQFKEAYKNMTSKVRESLEQGKLKDKLELSDKKFPVRRIITAGDDICFVAEGRIGLECAVIFIRELCKLRNQVDGKSYSACAGVAIVHQKYPFYKAYELAEMLCSNAKKFGAGYSEDKTGKEISAIDWHIEFGEMKDSLEEIRESYRTNDRKRLELRPYIVNAPDDIMKKESIRRYENFRKLITKVLDNDIAYARGKMKELRNVLKEGSDQAEYYIKFNKLQDFTLDSYQGTYTDVTHEKLFTGEGLDRKIFVETNDQVIRSIAFDAIEMLDTFIAVE